MSIAIMAPISTHQYHPQYHHDLATSPPPTTLELSRSTATYFAQSSQHSLPSPSLPSWSLHRSFSSNSYKLAKHPRSTRLIDDEPDRAEEDHMRGVKRNRRGMRMATAHPSPTATASSPMKRQCRTNLMLPLYKPSNAKQQPEGSSFGVRPSQQDPASSISGTKPLAPSEIFLLPKRLAKTRTPVFSSPPPPPRSKHCHDSNGMDSKKNPTPLLDDNDDDDDDDEFAHCVPPTRPLLRRRSTIRDSFDLACSMEEFASLIAS